MIADRAWMQYSPCMKRRSVLLHAVMLAALFLPAFSGWAQHVVVLSIDGLLPDFYLSATNRNLCRNLAALRDRGSSARSMIAVYPSVTYASHASLATGTTPARHGVTANNVFDPVTVNGRGFWFASDVQVPTIWDAAKKAGLTTAALSWPTTAGSTNLDWNFPEFWTSPEGREIDFVRRYVRGDILQQAQRAGRRLENVRLDNMAARDSFMTAAAVDILRRDKPNLLLVHLINLDHMEHDAGRNSAEVRDAMRQIDFHLRSLVTATRVAGTYDDTTFIVLGDHGSANVEFSIAPNTLLAQAGFLKERDGRVEKWKALVQNTGGSAALYLHDPSDTGTLRKVTALLEKNRYDADGNPLFAIISRAELTRIHGPAKPALYLEGAPGVMFSGSIGKGSWIRRASLDGNHGYLPHKPEMLTGFVISGAGARQGVELEQVRGTDVAPTIAALLGVRFQTDEGRVLREFLK